MQQRNATTTHSSGLPSLRLSTLSWLLQCVCSLSFHLWWRITLLPAEAVHHVCEFLVAEFALVDDAVTGIEAQQYHETLALLRQREAEAATEQEEFPASL